MIRVVFILFCILTSPWAWSGAESSQSLLDNRFRVDPTIEQISFVIYREKRSSSVVLVRPDGKKYYAWDHPETVSWYEENGMDIVSIEDPMPGPWQAVGKVTPKNHITLLSNLRLHVDNFPSRLYENEKLKFTARLTHDGRPLVLKDFLDRVRLRIQFSQFVDEENSEQVAKSSSTTLGTFKDDGKGLDEIPGDGVFTVEIPIGVKPGKYKAIITSGNGVFLRAVEQNVLVYPSPVSVSFIQAREESQNHRITIAGEQGMVLPGTLAATVAMVNPEGERTLHQQLAEKEALSAEMLIPNDPSPGRHMWSATVYATEGAAQRELILDVPQTAFSVLVKMDVEKSTAEYLRIQEEKRKALELEKLRQEREDARMSGMIMIMVGNLVVIVVGLLAWFIIRKLRMRKIATPTMQLSAPPK